MKAFFGVVLATSAIVLSVVVPFIMQEPPVRWNIGLRPQGLAVGLSLAILILLVIRVQKIWVIQRIYEVREHGPNLFGYAVSALAFALLLFLSDLSNLQSYLPKDSLGDFVLIVRFCLVSTLISVGIGLLALLFLSDWLAEKGWFIQPPSRDADYTQDYDLTNLVINKLKAMNQDLRIPWGAGEEENQPRISHHEWLADKGMFKLEIAWKDNVRKHVRKTREEKGETKLEVEDENTLMLRRCEVIADAKGRITSIKMLKPETI